jgi:release factor glutamine methyltransferase
VTIQEAYIMLKKKLEEIYEPRESANISNWVMEDITGLPRIERIMQYHLMLSDEQVELYNQYSNRLLDGMPVQYVTGYAWFMGLRFRVNENVLIPRPETEELVHWAEEEISNLKKEEMPLNILDIGTGSGCIPLILKLKIPGAEVYSIDISAAALEVAKMNALDHHAEIKFLEDNFLDPETWERLPEINLLISNPPYIPNRDKDTIARNVLHFEPHLALFVDNADPLIFYRSIAAFAQKKLKKNGCIFLEMGEDQAGTLKKLMQKSGFHVEVKKDLQGRSRMMKLALS